MHGGAFTAAGTTTVDPLRQVTEALAVAFVVQDHHGRIVDFNRAALDVLGLSADQMTGRTSFDPRWRSIDANGEPFHGARHPAMVTLRTGQPIDDVPMGIRRPDGSFVWLSVSSRLLDPGNPTSGVVATFVDTTELRARDRAYRTVQVADRVLMSAADPISLLQESCELIVTGGQHRLAWVARARDDPERSVEIAAAAGNVAYLYDGIVTWDPDKASGRGPVGTALRDRTVVLVEDIIASPSFSPWLDRAVEHGFNTIVAIPFRMGPDPAALAIYSSDAVAFDEPSLQVLTHLGRNLEFGLDHLERVRRLGHVFESTVSTFANVIEIRDPYTSGHQRRVARLAAEIASRLGLRRDEIDVIRLGATVHDIGKVGVPAELLSKPAGLAPIEFELVKRHAAMGETILRRSQLPSPIPEIAGQHHERVDGSGYPNGLVGEEIDVAARIVAVADVVEAMAHHRPYRPALGIGVALSTVRERAGTDFDADVVAACGAVFAGAFDFEED